MNTQKIVLGLILLVTMQFSCSPEETMLKDEDVEEMLDEDLSSDEELDDSESGEEMNDETDTDTGGDMSTDEETESEQDDMVNEDDSTEEEGDQEEETEITYTNTISLFFETHCVDCHNVNFANFGVSLDSYDSVVLNEERIRLSLGFAEIPAIMPPNYVETQPTDEELQDVLTWLDAGLPE